MAYVGPRGIPLSRFLSWTQYDQDAALAWQAHESRRCPGCGWHPQEGPARPHAHLDTCPGCVEIERTQATEEAKGRGVRVRLARKGGDCERCNSEGRG